MLHDICVDVTDKTKKPRFSNKTETWLHLKLISRCHAWDALSNGKPFRQITNNSDIHWKKVIKYGETVVTQFNWLNFNIENIKSKPVTGKIVFYVVNSCSNKFLVASKRIKWNWVRCYAIEIKKIGTLLNALGVEEIQLLSQCIHSTRSQIKNWFVSQHPKHLITAFLLMTSRKPVR